MLIEPLSGDADVLSDFAAEVQKQGTRVVEATLGAKGALGPFGALLAALGAPSVEARPPNARHTRPSGRTAEAETSAAHSSLTAVGQHPPHSRLGRLALLQSIKRAISVRAAREETLFLLTDVHRADVDTLDCLRSLLDDFARPAFVAPDDAPPFRGLLLLTGSTVDGSCGHAAQVGPGWVTAPWAVGLMRHEALDVYRLGGLGLQALARLLGPGPLFEHLQRVSRGNLCQLERFLGALPDDLGRLLAMRWDDLAPAERDTLAAAAVLDGHASSHLLSVVTGLSSGALASTVARLSRMCLLHVEPEQVTLGPVFDAAWLRERLGPVAWAELHRRAARFLAMATGGRDKASCDEEQVRHWLAAGAPRQAIGPAMAAARILLAQLSPLRARAVVEAVVERLPSGGAPTELTELLACIYEGFGENAPALALRERLLTGDSASDLLQLAHIARLANRMQDTALAAERLGAALAAARANKRPDIEQLLLVERAESLFRSGDFDGAANLASSVVSDSETSVTDALGNAACLLGKIALVRCEWQEAERQFRWILDRSADAGLPLSLAARARHNLGLIALRRGQPDEACRCLEAAKALCDAANEPLGAAKALENLGAAHEARQEYDLAIRYIGLAADAYDRLGFRADLAHALGGLADLYLTAGDAWTAGRFLRRAGDVASAEGLAHCAAFLALKNGEAALAVGEYIQAQSQLTKARERFHEEGALTDEALALLGLLHLAEARGDRGQTVVLGTAIRRLPADRIGHIKAVALLVEARLAAADGDLAGLAAALDEALPVLETGTEPLHAAEASRLRAWWADQLGRPESRIWHERARRVVHQMAQGFGESLRERFLQRVAVRRILDAADLGDVSRLAATQSSGTAACGADELEATAADEWATQDGILGTSPAWLQALRMAARIAACDQPVLILGETGCGKELVARAIYRRGGRNGRPFVKLNAAVFSDELLSSELFGHEKGAFTGALARRLGQFELANGGTLFLDEIGDISPRMQVSLLRVLQEREFYRVGGSEPVQVDVRVIFATNRDLEHDVSTGRFRMDLYYRIQGLTVRLPALRERRGDIRLLASHFLAKLAAKNGRKVRFRDQALARLETTDWPGNIRQLESCVQSAFYLTQAETIGVDDLLALGILPRSGGRTATPSGTGDDVKIPQGFSLVEARREFEIRHINAALALSKGNISAAARLLDLRRARLSQKIAEYGIPVPGRRHPRLT